MKNQEQIKQVLIMLEESLNEFNHSIAKSWGNLDTVPAYHDKEFMASKVGDVIEVNGNRFVVLTRLNKGMKSLNVSFDTCYEKDLPRILSGDSKRAFATFTVKRIKSFKKIRTLAPNEIKRVLNLKNGVDDVIQTKTTERYDANSGKKDWKDGYWQVQCTDGSWVKEGDNVLVRFDNGNFPMRIKSVTGTNKTSQIMIIRPSGGYGQKARGIDASRLIKKM